MNMFKKNGGFTLVELIVVIAILAILAGVAVPAYTGYIAKAKQAGDMQVLSTVNTAVQGLAAANGKTVTEIKVGADYKISYTPADAATASDVTALLDGDLTADDFTDEFAGAIWTKDTGKWTATYTNK